MRKRPAAAHATDIAIMPPRLWPTRTTDSSGGIPAASIAVVTAGVSPSATPAANCASEKPSCASSPPSSASVPGIATSHDHVPSGWGILWMVTVPGREAPPWAGS